MKNDRYSLNTRITREENDRISILRKRYCVNISSFIRKSLDDLWKQMEKK